MTEQVGRGGRTKLPLIGAQISTAGGFAAVPERAAALGAEVVQIFASNPRMWPTRTPGPEETTAFSAGLRRHRLPLFIHTIYFVNLASPEEEHRQRSAQAVAQALIIGALAGAAGVVSHVGSHLGQGFEGGSRRVVLATLMALEAARGSLAACGCGPALPPLLFEAGAGSGTTLGGTLEELAALLAMLPSEPALPRALPDPTPAGALSPGAGPAGPAPPRFGVCLDTAHLFAAGYAVHEAEGLASLIAQLKRLDLLSATGLVHLNDSTAPFASHRDRHENPGDGQIGYDGLARVVRHPALVQIPFVLEVPGADGRGPDAATVALAKRMRAGRPMPARRPPEVGRPPGRSR